MSWFSVPSYFILEQWVQWTKQLPGPETTPINIVPTFQKSLEKFGNLVQEDQEVTASICHDPPLLSGVVLPVLFVIRSHYPSIFPWLLVPVKHSPNQRGFLALTHLFQHDCWVSKEDLFDTNEIFFLLRSLSHIELCLTFIPPSAAVYYTSPNSRLFFRHFYLECPGSQACLVCSPLVLRFWGISPLRSSVHWFLGS